MSSRKSKNFRPYVPVLLNGKLVQYYFSNGEPHLRLQVNVRKYKKNEVLGNWKPKKVLIQFERRVRNLIPDKKVTVFGEKPPIVVEEFYTCDNNAIRFEQEQIPFVTE
jgi:hypothetical protein